MQEIIATNRKLEDCPFCGKPGYLFKDPLWSSGHGYYGNYMYNVGCLNPKCNIKPKTYGIDDIYRSPGEAIDMAIRDWNERR